jgi:lipoate-protein ligase A
MKWRLIITPDVHPFLNMALDEVLLNSVQPNRPALRLYSWRPPAISIGHFQKEPREGFKPSQSYLVVRRLTGGGAIVHQGDITYSMVLADISEVGLAHHAALYDLAHKAFAQALGKLGVAAQKRGASSSKHKGFFCSERESAYDLIWKGGKMLGSAQRRRGPALLQHGSLPLVPNPFEPNVVSVNQVVGHAIAFQEIADLLREAFAETFAADLISAQFSAEEWEEAHRLAQQKYAKL